MQNSTGRHDQFVKNWTRCEPRVFAYIYTLAPNWSDAQDILQETSVVLWNKLDEFVPGTDFVRWACRVAYFEVQKYRHRQHTQAKLLSESFLDFVADRMSESSDELQAMMAALGPCVEKLKLSERQLVRDHFILGANVKDAAAQVGISVDAAYKSLQRIRRKLFECVRRGVRREELP